MRYYIDFDRILNMLVPFYMRGRKVLLYLEALMSPLREINDQFVAYAKETRIEASMTSQVFQFEWYLNRKFSKYFLNGGRITLANSVVIGTPLYWQSANVPDSEIVKVRQQPRYGLNNELIGGEEDPSMILYRSDEKTINNSYSFVVSTPRINTALIDEDKYIAMLTSIIEKYRIANKTYIIKYYKDEGI